LRRENHRSARGSSAAATTHICILQHQISARRFGGWNTDRTTRTAQRRVRRLCVVHGPNRMRTQREPSFSGVPCYCAVPRVISSQDGAFRRLVSGCAWSHRSGTNAMPFYPPLTTPALSCLRTSTSRFRNGRPRPRRAGLRAASGSLRRADARAGNCCGSRSAG